MAPDDGITADDLVRRADLALYRAKAEGRSFTRFFEPAMDAHVERRTTIERELRAAVADQKHRECITSRWSISTATASSVSRRWRAGRARRSATWFPNVFITIAEECGLIHRLGDQLLRTACRDAMDWPSDFTLAFNISPLQLRDPTFGLRVLGILGETGLPPARLELEITESAIVGDALLAQRMIDQLRAAGVRIALDDFGTGYATMSQLLSFRFDKIKIDRSFVSNLAAAAIAKSSCAPSSGSPRVGTDDHGGGHRDRRQLAGLKADGCVEGQGYLFGKAIPAAQIPGLLRMPSIAAEVA